MSGKYEAKTPSRLSRLVKRIGKIPHLFAKVTIAYCVAAASGASWYALRIMSRTGNDPAALLGVILGFFGGGLAVECTPAWKNGVQITAVANIGSKSGYNARKWKKWGKIPYVTYEEEIDMSNEELKALIRQTVKEVLDEENPVYKDLKDVPEYWKGAAAALLDSGAVNGGTPKEVCATDLNLRKETLKAAIVAVMYHEAREKA